MGKIEINNIRKEFGSKVALKDISVQMDQGRIYGLIGKNGAGKTTLMKILCGIIKPSDGTFKLDGSRIGALIEEPAAYENMTARENLEAYMSNYTKPDKHVILDILKQVGLDDDKKMVKDYSLGMKKRLGIAMALINNPSFLILDEPTSGLDINGINETRDIVRDYMKKENRIVLISSHDTRDIVELCDSIIFIDNGKMIKQMDDFEKDSILLEKTFLSLIDGGATC